VRFSEFTACIARGDAPQPDTSLSIGRAPGGDCTVEGLYALPLEATSTIFPHGNAIIVCDDHGVPLGHLLTCQGDEFAIPQFSAAYLTAYLAEVDSENYGRPGRFERDYFLVHQDRLEEYRSEFMASSSIWGGFKHLDAQPRAVQITTSASTIFAKRGVKLSSDVHIETASRAVMQPQAFERFLKLYHLVELTFDQEIVRRIQSLGADLKGIGQILSNYESKEFDRLKQIVGQCSNAPEVVACIRDLCADTRWHSSIKTIFFDYGKHGNPLVGKEIDFFAALSSTGFTLDGFKSFASVARGQSKEAEQRSFETFALALAAYWIYRVRSSIAHSRIGEYVMRSDDEPFVAFFAEKLLRSVLCGLLR
jgi:hypothetical protein